MHCKKYALGALLLLATLGLAEKTIYTVKSGDTLSRIATKVGSNPREIARVNGLKESSILRLGMKLQVPGTSHKSISVPKSGLVVRKGDNDEVIAKRLGVSSVALRLANPGIKWSRLQIGQTLRKPGSVAPVASSTGYKVKEGENDWVIASRLGVSVKALRAANKGVNLAKLQIGQIIRVPATVKVADKGIRSRYATVTGDGVNLRAGSTTGSKKLDSLEKGAKVTIIDRKSDWYRVKSGNVRGWVRGDLLAAANAPVAVKKTTPKIVASSKPKGSRVARGGAVVSASNLIDHAFSLRGTRYVWGGTSRSGVDCSGFTTNVFRSQGIKLPRTSRDQSQIGQYVSKGELQQGDLVFFKTARRGYINHVGIYAGNGQFIHSSSSQGGVRLDRIDSGYYSRQFVTARRVAKASKSKPTVIAKTTQPTEPTVSVDTYEVPTAPKPKSAPGTDEIIR